MSEVTPRPEFGKPETGMIHHWNARGYLTPAQEREAAAAAIRRSEAAKRAAETRRYNLEHKAEWEERERRAAHRHFFCRECIGGLVDVGISSAHEKKPEVDRDKDESRTCCVCLVAVPIPHDRKLSTAPRGPNWEIFRCRVLDPEEETVEMEAIS